MGGAAPNIAEVTNAVTNTVTNAVTTAVTNAVTNAIQRVRRNRPEKTVFFIVVRLFGDSWTLKQTATSAMVDTERKLRNAAGVVDVRSADELQTFRVMKKH